MSANDAHAVGGPGCTHPSAARSNGAGAGHGARRRPRGPEIGARPRFGGKRYAEPVGEVVDRPAGDRDADARRAAVVMPPRPFTVPTHR